MAGMERAFDVAQKVAAKDLELRAERCVKVRNRNAGCTKCMDVCPARAISCAENVLEVDWAACLGCGACVAVCPTEVFAQTEGDDALFQRARAAAEVTDGVACFVCEPLFQRAQAQIDATKAIVVPCLGRLNEALLVRLAAEGAAGIVLSHAECAECACSVAGMRVDTVIRGAHELVSAWGGVCRITARDKLPTMLRRTDEAAFDEGRRSFFSSLRREAKQVTAIAVETAVRGALDTGEGAEEETAPLSLEDALPRLESPRRTALLAALDALAQDGPVADGILSSGSFVRISISRAACKGCRMCALFCPVGALRPFDMADGAMGVKHMPALCVNCGCCRDICPVDALGLHAAAKASDVANRTSFAYYMDKPTVILNRPDSMYQTVRRIIDTDQLYDVQR